MNFQRYIAAILKKAFGKVRIKLKELASAIIEAGRTISYVETVSNKADTLHRNIKNNSERDLKKAFELNTRKAISRMGLGRVTLAVDGTNELYYGRNGELNVRQIKHDNGTGEAFTYIVLSIVEPRPLPLMAIPYKQGDDQTAIVKELLKYARTLRITIKHVLFDRGFYIGELIDFLSSMRIKYLIFVPENKAIKKYIEQTGKINSFLHEIKWKKYQSSWKTTTRIVIIESEYFNRKKDEWQDCHWCFATNLKESLDLIIKYKKRWQIETDFRVHDEARIKSKSNEHIVRYFYFLTSLVLMANWQVNRIANPKVCFKKYLKQLQEAVELEVT